MATTTYETKNMIPFPKEIRFHPELTFGEKVFLAEVRSMTKEGKCPFSCRQLGELFGVSHQTIANWVKKLVKLEYLDVQVDYANEEHKQFLITK